MQVPYMSGEQGESGAGSSQLLEAHIRTSDRYTFRRCRRKWGWSSHLHNNLEPSSTQEHFWFGSAMHWALEDFHGYNRYGSPVEAFRAYHDAWLRNAQLRKMLPDNHTELLELG